MQEDQYSFPYHYLPSYAINRVNLTRKWGWSLEYLGRIEIITNFLKRSEFNDFVDFGCGDGRLINILSSLFDAQFTGYDYSNRAIQFARVFNHDRPNVKY